MISVRLLGDSLRVNIPFSELHLAQGIPQRRWLAKSKEWSCRPSLANMDYLARTFPDGSWDDAAIRVFAEAKSNADKRERVKSGEINIDIIWAEYKAGLFKGSKPWSHVAKALLLGRDMAYFAYVMDQGTGKTRTILDDAGHNFRAGRIDALIVLNKNSVKTNWVEDKPDPSGELDAVDTYLSVPNFKAVWMSAPTRQQQAQMDAFYDCLKRKDKRLAVISVNYDALNMDRCFKMLERLCAVRKVMIVADESTMIGKPGSGRTRQATKLRKACVLARICTGTPIIKSPLKAYSQFGFLSEDILGFGSFYAFKARYCVMGGFEGRQVLHYQNLEELSDKIASCAYRVLKDECLDLPPKVYQKRRVYMTKEQEKAYNEMRRVMFTEIDGKEIAATIQLTQIMKLQQITGGYVMDEKGNAIEIVKPEKNPLMREVLELMEERGEQQVVIWAHFKEEIRALAILLTKEGYRVAQFHGDVPEGERLQIRRDFKAGKYDVIVANQAAGGMGIDEFKVASLVIYYSNSYNTEDRIQSEDRTHRGAMPTHIKKVTYYDLIVPNTVRVKIIATLRANVEISQQVMRDGMREWI